MYGVSDMVSLIVSSKDTYIKGLMIRWCNNFKIELHMEILTVYLMGCH